MDEQVNTRSRVTRLERLNATESGGEERSALGASVPVELVPVPEEPARPPASNLIRNGDYSHSVNTWNEAVAALGTDKVLECAHWFSHDAPAAAQALDFTDARTSSANKTLKATGHSTYNANYCDWGLPEGISRFTGLKSLDAPFPNNFVKPGFPMYVGAIIARRNATIVAAADCRIAAMLYDNTPGAEDFIKSGNVFHLEGVVRGAPAGTTERRYKVLAETDRGYSFISDELVLANAPNDASFTSDVDVFLTWPRIEGVLRYRIFRHNVVAGTFDELREITSGANSYGDNNSKLFVGIGGYPAGTDDRVKCYVATLEGALVNLAIDGVDGQWDSLFLNIPVPNPLASSGSGHQVLRLALTKALDRQMNDAQSNAASNSIQSATGAFTTLDTGRIATLKNAAGVVLHGPEAITFVDATHVTFATNVATSNVNATLYIVGGGDHGILIDMAHVGYLSRASYGPHPEDGNRTLPSTAAPNTSSQGGVGVPGDSGDPGDGGIGGCVEVTTLITILQGNDFLSRMFKLVNRGQPLRSGNLVPNTVLGIKTFETDNLYVLRTENNIYLECSPGQVVFSSFMDRVGVPVNLVKKGDYVLTCAQGRDECSRIVECRATGRSAAVGTFALAPSNKFVAGRQTLRWWQKVLWCFGFYQRPSGIYCHNRKPLDLFL